MTITLIILFRRSGLGVTDGVAILLVQIILKSHILKQARKLF